MIYIAATSRDEVVAEEMDVWGNGLNTETTFHAQQRSKEWQLNHMSRLVSWTLSRLEEWLDPLSPEQANPSALAAANLILRSRPPSEAF
jgi:hypothetical protein